ncbi:MAG: hypothetical protein KAU03_04370 [Candidatus Altiarchaeales archaeon]|nr:hypothetical protein [Candidatus Altiarchaeales archaeon]
MSRNPWIAAILSLIIAGLGQLYVGRILRAGAFFAMEFTTSAVYIYVDQHIGFFLNLLVGVWAAIDAYRLAKESPTGKEELQEKEEKMPELYI